MARVIKLDIAPNERIVPCVHCDYFVVYSTDDIRFTGSSGSNTSYVICPKCGASISISLSAIGSFVSPYLVNNRRSIGYVPGSTIRRKTI